MKKAELEALKARVDGEPRDSRGALARELLAEVERSYEAGVAANRSRLHDICAGEHLSREELEKVLSAFDRGEDVGHETGDFPCPACKGRGDQFSPACVGVKHEECSKCHGSGRVGFRILVPAAAECKEMA